MVREIWFRSRFHRNNGYPELVEQRKTLPAYLEGSASGSGADPEAQPTFGLLSAYYVGCLEALGPLEQIELDRFTFI
jgi:hypothetical protein